MNSDDRSNLDFLLGLDPEEAVDVLEEFSQEDLDYANQLLEACLVAFAQRQQLLDQLCPEEDPAVVLATRPPGTTLH